jgi:hypothetical protein
MTPDELTDISYLIWADFVHFAQKYVKRFTGNFEQCLSSFMKFLTGLQVLIPFCSSTSEFYSSSCEAAKAEYKWNAVSTGNTFHGLLGYGKPQII